MYIFETPAVVHQFFNGPEETEAVFFGDFAVEFVDPETLGVTASLTAEVMLKTYFEMCEERGVKPRYLS